jgi:hypothetical protein
MVKVSGACRWLMPLGTIECAGKVGTWSPRSWSHEGLGARKRRLARVQGGSAKVLADPLTGITGRRGHGAEIGGGSRKLHPIFELPAFQAP